MKKAAASAAAFFDIPSFQNVADIFQCAFQNQFRPFVFPFFIHSMLSRAPFIKIIQDFSQGLSSKYCICIHSLPNIVYLF